MLQVYGAQPLPSDAARSVPGWRGLAARRLLASGIGRAVVAGYGLLAVVALLAAAAILVGRLPLAAA